MVDGIINSTDVSSSKHEKTVKDRGAWRAAVHCSPGVRYDFVTNNKKFSSVGHWYHKLQDVCIIENNTTVKEVDEAPCKTIQKDLQNVELLKKGLNCVFNMLIFVLKQKKKKERK